MIGSLEIRRPEDHALNYLHRGLFRPQRHVRFSTALILVSLLVAACGGGEAAEPAASPTTQTASDAGSPTPTDADTGPATEEQVITVGLSAVFGGFQWNVVEARLGTSAGTPAVFVSIDVENLGSDDDSPGSELSLETPEGVIANSGFGVTAKVAPASSENGVYEFKVSQEFIIEDSTLLIGRDGGAQASIPLGGGNVVSLEPIEVAVDEVGTGEAIELRLASVVIDWHSLGTFDEAADEGTSFLTAVLDITLGDQSRTAKDTFELVLPNGETVTPERAPNEVLKAGVTAEGLEVAFIIPDPIAGDYRLRLFNLSRFPEDSMAEVSFTVGE